MNQQEQQFDRIEAFLKGTLAPEEHAAMKEEIAHNPELAKLVAQHRLEQQSIELLLEDDLRGKLKDWKESPDDTAPRSNNYRILWILAGLILILLLLIWFLLPQQADRGKLEQERDTTEKLEKSPLQNNKEETNLEEPGKAENTEEQTPVQEKRQKPLPQANAEKETKTKDYLALVKPASVQPSWVFGDENIRGEASENVLKSVKELVEQQQFTEAIGQLTAIAPSDEYYWDAQNNLGYAYFKQKNYKKAAEIFERLIYEQPYYLYRENAEWHLILSYLQSDQKGKADVLIDAIKEDEGHMYNEAVEELVLSLE